MTKRKIDKYQVSLKVFLKNDRGEVLAMGGRFKNPAWADKFDFPGGRIDIEEFETPFIDIAARELREECGDIAFDLDPKPVALGRHRIAADGDVPEIHVLYVFFEAKLTGGDVIHSAEHTGHRWIDLAAADLETLFASGNLQGVRSYLNGAP